LHHAFPLDVLTVPSSAIVITTDSEHLKCGGFSLGKIVPLGNFKFIADYFDDLRLSPSKGNIGAAFMGSTRSAASTSQWAMIEESVEEFLTASCAEGSFDIPSPKRRGMGASLAPITTTP
jgi:hypothetical protein